MVSINHRITVLLESYFDILFAINRQLHPGEKRLIQITSEKCSKLPENMGQHVQELTKAISLNNRGVLSRAEELIDGLTNLLNVEGLLPVL